MGLVRVVVWLLRWCVLLLGWNCAAVNVTDVHLIHDSFCSAAVTDILKVIGSIFPCTE